MNSSWVIYPAGPHVPGQNARPRENKHVVSLLARLPVRVTLENWNEVEAYHLGIAFYKDGFFWEAHEMWEAVWMRCMPNSREKYLVQGLIQLTNAALKGQMGRKNAALKLILEAKSLFNDAFLMNQKDIMGISYKNLIVGLDGFEERLKGDGNIENAYFILD